MTETHADYAYAADMVMAQDNAQAAALYARATYELLLSYADMIGSVSEAVVPAIDAIGKSPVGRMLGL